MVAVMDIRDLGKSLGACADAIAKLGDAIAHLVQLGTSGFDAALARRTRSRLKDVDARLTQYFIGQTAIAESVNEYIEHLEKSDATITLRDGRVVPRYNKVGKFDWEWLIGKIKDASIEVDDLLLDLKRERSDFVLESAYAILLTTLDARLNLFDRLIKGPEPRSIEDVAALREVATEWGRLRRELKRATSNLSTYLKDDSDTAERRPGSGVTFSQKS